MVIVSNTLTNVLQFYDFSTGVLTNVPISPVGTVSYVSTHRGNTNTSYCLRYQDASYGYKTAALNSDCVDGSIIFDSSSTSAPFPVYGFGANSSEFYVGVNQAGTFSTLYWSRASGNFSDSFVFSGYSLARQIYYNNSIFYISSNPSFTDLAIYRTELPGKPVYYGHFEYPITSCIIGGIDFYEDLMLVNCRYFVEVRLSYPPFSLKNNFTMPTLMNEAAFSVNGTSFVVKNKTAQTLWQYTVNDGQLMDQLTFSLTTSSFMKRIGSDKMFNFNTSAGFIYSLSSTIVCQAVCNCQPPYVQQGQ